MKTDKEKLIKVFTDIQIEYDIDTDGDIVVHAETGIGYFCFNVDDSFDELIIPGE